MKAFPGLPAVDRRLFIPDEIFVSVELPWEQWHPHLKETHPRDSKIHQQVRVSRKEDPAEWERWVTSDEALVTQLTTSGFPSSSSSAPWVMAVMLQALDVRPGMRVLEIGTGTGWNAACLAALGAQVVSLDIDPGLVDNAERAVKRAGYDEAVTVVLSDGEFGFPPSAPYDRIIATAAAHTVPYPWVEQTIDGGRIVVPYTGPYSRDGLAVLSVHDGMASGTIEGEAAFMPLRGQRLSQQDFQDIPESAGPLRIEVSRDRQRIWAET